MTARYLHIITGLTTGGAEAMLHKLIAGWPDASDHHTVVSLTDMGTIGPRLQQAGATVIALKMKPGITGMARLFRLKSLTDETKPHLIQGWMYHGNLAASLAKTFAPRSSALAWNVRHSVHDIATEKPFTRIAIHSGARLARHPGAIIFNSRVSSAQHERLGYRNSRVHIIPNGFDPNRFCESRAARRAIRAELGIPEKAKVVGGIARFHPMKDHAAFLKAAARLLDHLPDTHFVLAGRDVTWENPALAPYAAALPRDKIHLLGERADVPEVMNSFDLLSTSSAWGEAFPNILGEGMACGLPCVATDVGDSADVIGDAGRVVPPRDPAALAEAWLSLLSLPANERSAMGRAARKRVVRLFSLASVARRYQELYRSLTL